MNLSLREVEYTEAGPGTLKGCLRVVPGVGGSTGEKVAVGNTAGELRVFGVNQSTSAIVDSYRAQAFNGSPVNCMCLATVPASDKKAIFVGGKAHAGTGGDVKGYSRRKKVPFLNFSSRLADPLIHVETHLLDLYVASESMFTHFLDCEDNGFFAPPNKITGLTYLTMDETECKYPVIASDDRLLRVLKDTNDDEHQQGVKDIMYEVEIPGLPRSMIPYFEKGLRSSLLYGTKDGRLGLTHIDKARVKQRFCLSNEEKRGSIETMDFFDLDEDGISEIVVGRDDGHVEVYRIERGEHAPYKCADHEFSESITSVSCGNVGSANHSEVVLSTYSGRIFGLTMNEALPPKTAVKEGGAEVAGDTALRISALKKEIDELKHKVGAKNDELVSIVEKEGCTVDYIADPYINVKDDFSFNETEGNYVLQLEMQINLDYLTLRADSTMDILDVDKNTVLPSKCAPDPERGSLVLYTFRCQPNTRRVQLKVRPIEGQQGTLTVMVVPKGVGTKYKLARELNYAIPPLCLHSIIHVDDSTRPVSTLKYTGTASVEEMHAILYTCLPNLGDRPQQVPSNEDVFIVFQSAITKTIVRVIYRPNELTLESDNVSTLSILKEFLGKRIAEQRIALKSTIDVNPESVPFMLNLLHDKICHQISLSQKLHLWEALKEVELSEGQGSITSPEYKEILVNGEELLKEHRESNSLGERLFGTITDLYIDSYRLEGIDSKRRVDELLQLLDNYNLEQLLEFFKKDPNDADLWQESTS